MIPGRWKAGFALATVVVVVGALFAPAWDFEFLSYWDDDDHVTRNPLFHPLTGGSFRKIWAEPYEELYIPVAYSAWACQVALCGGNLNPAVFHSTNILVHVLSAAMAFALLRRLLQKMHGAGASPRRIAWAAAAGALLFALHPLQVEPVAWVSGLRDVLGGMFGVAALWGFVVACEATAWRRSLAYGAATLALLLALGAKPSSVALPALATLIGIWPMRRARSFVVATMLPWFAAAIACVVTTSWAQPTAARASELVSIWMRPLVAGDALAFYLGKLLWPFGLSIDYGFAPDVRLDSGDLYWTWLIPAALIAALAAWRRARWALVPMALFVLALAPALGLMAFAFQQVSTVADRYAYLALLGPALAVGYALARAPRAAFIAAAVVLAGLATLSELRLGDWSNGERLFHATLRANPRSWTAHHNYGSVLDDLGRFSDAIPHLEEAIRLRPNSPMAHNDLAVAYVHVGRTDDAVARLRESLEMLPTAKAVKNLGMLLTHAGRGKEGAAVYSEALARNPQDWESAQSLAWMLATYPDDDVRDGVQALRWARQLMDATSAPERHLVLAVALAQTGDFPGARAAAHAAEKAFYQAGNLNASKMVLQDVLPALAKNWPIRDPTLKEPFW
jgi:Flp pilus assembly protein TadD